ncbi:SMAD/FHA domain-containing protein, partial [Sistotremastrum niveocremeum HHB9708]
MPAPFPTPHQGAITTPTPPTQPQNGTTVQNHSPFPALSLFPLNDTFIPKHITLNQRVKIGRQTNAKTVPGERNGYFDSKVLSRQHAEVWEEGGKIYIKDVKSSNGTFINGERLSPEGAESEPWELKSDDIVEFGIDIVSEDNRTIIHHKVAARVTCIFTPEDAMREQQQLAAATAHQQVQHFQAQQAAAQNHAAGHPQNRRPALQSGLGGMGGGPPRPKSGLTFDHILSRLQSELSKSRETTQELHGLSGTMTEINDTLGGVVAPPPLHLTGPLPVVREAGAPPLPSTQPQQLALPGPTMGVDIVSLQKEIGETKNALAGHTEKMNLLENLMSEHEGVKRELSMLRELIEEQRRE